jgi:tetratricopeptide (TPR) repeat protein
MTEDEGLKALRGDDPAAASRAEAALWAMWHRSGDREIDALLREGIALMERRDLVGAEAIFARMITQAPAFAEGWNKRATVRYVAENYEGSIADCEETLSRNPHHFGALSGAGLCFMALGRHREAASMFRRALAVHPRLGGVRQNLAAALGVAVRGNGH